MTCGQGADTVSQLCERDCRLSKSGIATLVALRRTADPASAPDGCAAHCLADTHGYLAKAVRSRLRCWTSSPFMASFDRRKHGLLDLSLHVGGTRTRRLLDDSLDCIDGRIAWLALQQLSAPLVSSGDFRLLAIRWISDSAEATGRWMRMPLCRYLCHCRDTSTMPFESDVQGHVNLTVDHAGAGWECPRVAWPSSLLVRRHLAFTLEHADGTAV